MQPIIETLFDVYSDTPFGRDPDSFSPTLRSYHRTLWSKTLPDGNVFQLTTENKSHYLHHRSHLGEWVLSSDSIGHTYRHVKSMAHIIRDVPKPELDEFFLLCSTIGAYIVFPARRIDGKPTINGARGLNGRIKDRFDLTLECIRLHYVGQQNPLSDVLSRYDAFFRLFGNFEGYVRFFLLEDLVADDFSAIKFFLPFDGFSSKPLPASLDEYRPYKTAVTQFVMARNDRIARQNV